jgi:hypothetical protein
MNIKYLEKTETIAYAGDTSNLEYQLISKILKLTNKTKKRISLIYSDDIQNQVIQ